MRPIVAVSTEILLLIALLVLSSFVPQGLPYILYLLATQFAATYLTHCPAHYLVGTLAGIRFRNVRLGRTTLARALPPSLSRPAGLVPILTLMTDRTSLSRVSKSRASAMYLSGTAASCASAIVIAAAITPSGSWPLVLGAWAFAIGYLLFDLVFSPRSGDLMRARMARAP